MKLYDAMKALFGSWVGPDPEPPTFPAPAGERHMVALYSGGEWHVFTWAPGDREGAEGAVLESVGDGDDRRALLTRMCQAEW